MANCNMCVRLTRKHADELAPESGWLEEEYGKHTRKLAVLSDPTIGFTAMNIGDRRLRGYKSYSGAVYSDLTDR